MKLKNIKFYLLIIFSIFLFNLNTQAIDLNIKNPMPGIFFNNVNSTPGNKKMIIQVILGAFEDNSNQNQFHDLDAKNKLISCFKDMKNNLDETNIIAHETYIDSKVNQMSQSIYIQFQKQQPFAVNLRSKCTPIVINTTKQEPISNEFFNKIKSPETNTKLALKKILKYCIPQNDATNFNLIDNLIKQEHTQIESTAEFDDSKYHNQCILISNNTDFYLFYFRSSLTRNETLKTSKEINQN